jgi:hypothetical protein
MQNEPPISREACVFEVPVQRLDEGDIVQETVVDQEQRSPWQPRGAHRADHVLLELNAQRSGHLLL